MSWVIKLAHVYWVSLLLFEQRIPDRNALLRRNVVPVRCSSTRAVCRGTGAGPARRAGVEELVARDVLETLFPLAGQEGQPRGRLFEVQVHSLTLNQQLQLQCYKTNNSGAISERGGAI